jgi:uncharacterized protein YehS (DUF1456 family)
MGFSSDRCIQDRTGQYRGSFNNRLFPGQIIRSKGWQTTSLRVEDRLDGASNFLSWKARVTLALKEYDLWEIVDKVVLPPTDPQDLAVHQKKEIKSQWVILDSVKDHLIPHLSEKKMTKEMFDALVGLFQSIT